MVPVRYKLPRMMRAVSGRAAPEGRAGPPGSEATRSWEMEPSFGATGEATPYRGVRTWEITLGGARVGLPAMNTGAGTTPRMRRHRVPSG